MGSFRINWVPESQIKGFMFLLEEHMVLPAWRRVNNTIDQIFILLTFVIHRKLELTQCSCMNFKQDLNVFSWILIKHILNF